MVSAAPPAILASIACGQTILTANQRAARTLRHASRSEASTPPEIFALDTWLAHLHKRLTLHGYETRLLLNPTQQHALWRDIIAADPTVSGLRSLDSLADLAARAWHLLHLYSGARRLREFNVSTDTRAFQRWAEAFARNASQHQYLTAAELPAALMQALADGTLDLPNPGLALVDFDALLPAHSELFANIRQAGYEVDSIRTALPSTSSLVTAEDDRSELRAAALWCRDRLLGAPSQSASSIEVGSQPSIAIVVPNLADRRPQIDRVFSEVFSNQTPVILSEVRRASPDERSRRTPLASPQLSPLSHPNSAPWEFSLGQPLAETAPVSDALHLLRWTLEPLPLDTITALLLSPFFGSQTPDQTIAAAEFDAYELRRTFLLRPELSLESTLNLARRSQRLPHLKPLLQSLSYTNLVPHSSQSHRDEWDRREESHTHWADHFRTLLEAATWTASTNRDSLAFQTRRRFDSALDELATLDFNAATVTAAEALQTLTRICRNAIFAPETRHAPIQILGPLEPGGTTFDALWFLSADDRNWPPPAASNPFLPWHIQRDLGIPAAADSSLAHTLTTRLAHSAPEAVFSYALHAEEGPRRPSPLLRALDLTSKSIPHETPHQPIPLDTIEDSEPLPPLPPGITPGGARILELQAACSFRAFAEIRLHATQPDSKDPGLDARERGIHVHKIMQIFWAEVSTQQALRALAPPEREHILDEAIEDAIARAASAARTPWEEAYLDVQRRRLRALLHPWLDFELNRPAFSVRQQEEKRFAQIGPLSLELRADRIDDTQGGPLILDYKTGLAAPSQWKGDRLEAPQLPLYAVLAPDAEKLGGLAFALLRAGDDLALKGYGGAAVLDSPTTNKEFATLSDQLEDWHRILTALAEAFAHNDPIANPKDYPRTCKHCAQRILCRLDVTALALSDDEDDEPALSPSS